MSGTALSIGQFVEFSSAVLKALPRDISPTDALAWSRNGEKLQAALRSALAPIAAPMPSNVLTFIGEHSVGPLAETFDPKKFFKNRKGLYVWGSFERVLAPAKKSEPTGATALKSFGLARDAYDREIKPELPDQHEVELWEIAKLIEGQPNGEGGSLLNNGYANIFYVSGLVVRVRWRAARREWDVSDWALGDDGWGAGLRVFSHAN